MPVWSRTKDKTPPAPSNTHTKRHARPRTTDPYGTLPRAADEALIIDETLRAHLQGAIGRLEHGATQDEAEAAQLNARAAYRRTIAAHYRRLIALGEETARRRQAPSESAYDEPQAEVDPSRFNPTWQLPQRGDYFDPAPIEPWQPEPEARGWLTDHFAPQDGNTETYPALVNGEAL